MAIGINEEKRIQSYNDLLQSGRDQVNRDAETSRLTLITSGDGMSIVYEQKRTEAARWEKEAAEGVPDIGTFVLMKERAGRLNGTPSPDQPMMQAVANEWMTKTIIWTEDAAIIEGLRETANEDIGFVPDTPNAEAEIQSIIDAILWPGM